ncbi:probable LRR receptor-like serine/threonine-protein kinase At3g47570 isoform X2 [Quercus robur]|uniref:probable LRR receptor-like serine/threonine-protein kinase At3g47570 isoform X2 n=1 Tax=Quercus robur TaxID=38942 RepID=UPI002162C9C5|nr:probable LRR receptor-like serine/threonine-protein kinase At3g47570 isoform X2 [Quercus robur]
MMLHQTNFYAFCLMYLRVILLFSTSSLLCLQPSITATTLTNETDRLALLKFKESVPYDPYNILSSWNDSMHFCNWRGITCGRRHQRVTALDLQSHGLRGSISPYIGNLSFLGFINLQSNSFYGEIPQEVSHLFRLQQLSLNNNTLEGEIPIILTNCSNLWFIQLGDNKLKGKIPVELGSLTKLELLWLPNNNLEGEIPSSLGNLSMLSHFDVEVNNLVGNIPNSIGQLQGLFAFTILGNKLSGNCSTLELLYLEGNSFEGAIPSSMASLKSLQRLDFSQNNLSGSIPKGLEKLPLLEKLNLSFNNFEGEVPTEGVFGNTSVILLIGNAKLCGGIPKLQLPKCPINARKPRKSIGFKIAIAIISIVLFFFLFSSIFVLYWIKRSRKKPPSMVSTKDLLPNVSYKELFQATSGFSPNNLIGSGSFGSVYKGALDPEERIVAIKVLNLQHQGASKSFMAECNALRNIRHRNLVKILTCCSSMDYNGNQFKALVFEFMTNGSLDIWLHPELASVNQPRNLSLLQRLNIAIDVAFAMDYLHNHSMQPIIHCDLKPSNVLLDNDMVAHVSDFGLARLLPITDDSSRKQTSTIGIKGSIGYAAPEYGMGGKASIEGDVYSYGILLLEMFIGRRPTDDMFKDGLNLHNFAKMALPENLVQIVNPILLPREVDEAPIAIVATTEDNNGNGMQVDEEAQGILNFYQMDPNVHKCLASILETGLACSMESPKDRMKMNEVTRELHLIKSAFLGSGISRGGFRRIQV